MPYSDLADSMAAANASPALMAWAMVRRPQSAAAAWDALADPQQLLWMLEKLGTPDPEKHQQMCCWALRTVWDKLVPEQHQAVMALEAKLPPIDPPKPKPKPVGPNIDKNKLEDFAKRHPRPRPEPKPRPPKPPSPAMAKAVECASKGEAAECFKLCMLGVDRKATCDMIRKVYGNPF